MIDDQEKARRAKIRSCAGVDADGMDMQKAISILKEFDKGRMNRIGVSWLEHAALIKVFEHFEEMEKHQQEPQQFVQVRKVLEFADSLESWSKTICYDSTLYTLMQREEMAKQVENFAQSLRNCVCPDRKQEYKATMYVWGGNAVLYDDDKRVWYGGLLTIADAMRAFGWDFERIEIDRDDLCGKAPPMSLKEMQELLAGVERQKKRERLAELREELADLEKELEGTK